MKRIVVILICLGYIFSLSTIAYATNAKQVENKSIPVYLDGVKIKFDISPVERNNRILVPFRAVAENLGSSVDWDATNKSVNAKSPDGLTKIKLLLNKNNAFVNDTPFSLDVPATEIKGRVLVPLRFFTQSMGFNVVWNAASSSVSIISSTKGLTPTNEHTDTHNETDTNNETINSSKKGLYVLGFYALGSIKANSWTDVFGKEYPETSVGNTDILDELAFGWYSLDETGNLLTQNNYSGWRKPGGWENALQQASNYSLRSQMTVQIVEDRNQTLSKLLNDETAMENAVNQITAEAKLFQAINLDIEQWGNIYKDQDIIQAQQKLTNFVSKISQRAKENNIKLVLSIHPLNSSYRGYDYTALTEVSDEIVIMAYEYQLGETEPIEKVLEAVEEALKVVPKEKLVLGINIAKESPESILEKVEIAKKHSLKGIALWRLGLLSDEMWSSLKNALSTTN